MSIVRWNPLKELDDVFDRYGELTRGFWGENLASNDWLPAVDIREDDDTYHIDVELPAVAPEDVNVTVKDGVLVVTGERRRETDKQEGKVHRVERHYGRFTRSFRLPENADEGRIDASSKNGVLYLSIQKREQVKPKAIEVKVA